MTNPIDHHRAKLAPVDRDPGDDESAAPQTPPPPILVTYAEAARLLSVSKRLIAGLVASGALTPVQIRGCKLIRHRDVVELAERGLA
jgi:excisionase family DNA binding protein